MVYIHHIHKAGTRVCVYTNVHIAAGRVGTPPRHFVCKLRPGRRREESGLKDETGPQDVTSLYESRMKI